MKISIGACTLKKRTKSKIKFASHALQHGKDYLYFFFGKIKVMNAHGSEQLRLDVHFPASIGTIFITGKNSIGESKDIFNMTSLKTIK